MARTETDSGGGASRAIASAITELDVDDPVLIDRSILNERPGLPVVVVVANCDVLEAPDALQGKLIFSGGNVTKMV